jgi:hypothetical protein
MNIHYLDKAITENARDVDDPVGQAIAALTSAAGTLYQLSMEVEHRERMIADLHHISEAALAINLVWSRVRAREQA